MNIYPGSGLGLSASLGNLGRNYATSSIFDYCTIKGVILTSLGLPAGYASSRLQNSISGTEIVEDWSGVKVTASHTPAATINGKIVGTGKTSTVTNETGYFEMKVIKGLTVTVACESFGRTITVDTAGHNSIDLSTYFT